MIEIDFARQARNYTPVNPDALMLRLACLKENFAYRDFWESSSPKILEYFKKRRSGERCNPFHFWRALEGFGIHFMYLHALSTEDIESILNPYKDGTLSEAAMRELPRILAKPALAQVIQPGDTRETSEVIHRKYVTPKATERLLLVDLTQSHAQLMEEFKQFLKRAGTEASRHRAEAWQQLQVWKMRRDRLSFAEIARRMGLALDAVKQSFYKAFERTQGRPYDREQFSRKAGEVFKGELGRTCENCPDREKCTVLCPDALKFITQDHECLKELLKEDLEFVNENYTKKPKKSDY